MKGASHADAVTIDGSWLKTVTLSEPFEGPSREAFEYIPSFKRHVEWLYYFIGAIP